jgi:tetratricopeptide (TPR) repeat protein
MSQSERHHETAITLDQERRPLVSVLVPTRDCEAHIRECLTGLMNQTVASKLEIIVIDQASEQSEWAVVPDLQRKYGNITYLRIAAGAGESAGFDLGVKIASGRYLTLVRATDRIKLEALGLLSAVLEADPAAMLAYGYTSLGSAPHESCANHAPLDGRWSGAHQLPPHPLWRREVHEAVGAIGEDDHSLRDFLSRVTGRFRAVHLGDCAEEPEIAAAAGPEPQRAAWQDAALPEQSLALSQAATPPVVVADPELAFAVIEPLSRGNDLQQALTALERHVARFPRHAVAHNDLATICYRLGDNEKALIHYRQAVQLAPEEETFQKNLADFLFVELGDLDEATAIYLELHRRSPNNVETLRNLAIICENVGQPGEAAFFYQKALEMEPWDQSACARLAELRQKLTAPPENLPLRSGRQQTPHERYQRAQSLLSGGDADAALRELEALLATDPDFAAAHNDLGVLNYQKGAKEKALAHYGKAAALAPDNSVFQKNLADFYFVERHDVDGAIAIYLEQLRKEPGDVETLMNLGRMSVLLDRPQEAETFFGKVAQLEPWNVTARDCLTSLRRCASAQPAP